VVNDGAAQLFDQVAETYDEVGVEFFQPIAAGLVDALRPCAGEHALDIGCGKGAALLCLARAVGPTGSATGVDISPRMVEHARTRARELGLVVDVRVGDASNPELGNRRFDVVASSLVLFFLPDPLAALGAWKNLSTGGGRVGVSTFGPYDETWAERVDAELARRAPASVRDARTSGRAGPFSSDEGMEQLFAAAGFHDVRTSHLAVTPRFDSCEHWYRWSMSVGQRRFWQSVPAEQLDAVKAEIFAAVDRCRDGSGRIGFDQTVRYTVGTV
jgi:ubiquinone/menaquinone biosynthesis C-methylase UbiE